MGQDSEAALAFTRAIGPPPEGTAEPSLVPGEGGLHLPPLAEHATVVAAHLGSGTTLLFANNPLYRGETIGSYALVTNAILGYQPPK